MTLVPRRALAAMAVAAAIPLGTLAPTAHAALTAPASASAGAPDPKGPSLREVTDLPVGSAVRPEVLDQTDEIGARYRETLAREFSMLVPESALRFDRLHSRAGADPANPVDADFNLDLPRPIFDLAGEADQEVRGALFIWHQGNPLWVRTGEYSDDQLLDVMRGHIRYVGGQYGDRVTTWDVVNEAFDQDGTLREACNPEGPAAGPDCGRNGEESKKSVWQRIGGPEDTGWIVEAFRTARESLPASAKLYYNDYDIETAGPKSDAALALVKTLREQTAVSKDGETLPLIDGIGFQTHIDTTWTPADTKDFRATMKRFTDLGLETQITEVDVSQNLPSSDESRRIQKRIFRDVATLCAENPACTAILTWGFTDRYQWIEERFPGQYGEAALFDKEFTAKPAYFGFRNGLEKAAKSRRNG